MHGVQAPNSVPAVPEEYLQLNQPPGVPPLPLTGERTLPDVPEENYWYRRHLVVYEWIATHVDGLHVVDVASGEGYGANVLAQRARSEEHTSELQSPVHLVCRLLLEKKKKKIEQQ